MWVKTVLLIQPVATMRVVVARNANLAMIALECLAPPTLTADPRSVAKEIVPPPVGASMMLWSR